MMVMAGDGGARPAFIQVRKGTIHASFHLARFDMHCCDVQEAVRHRCWSGKYTIFPDDDLMRN